MSVLLRPAHGFRELTHYFAKLFCRLAPVEQDRLRAPVPDGERMRKRSIGAI